jgi:DNA-binding HxlR family transcriptional regulator
MTDRQHYSYHSLDQLFHAPARLGIATALYANPDGLTFVELRELCELSDGNLSRHVQKLETDGVVRVRKEFVGRMPQTTVSLTRVGGMRFEQYVEQLRTIVQNDVPAPTKTAGTWAAPAQPHHTEGI